LSSVARSVFGYLHAGRACGVVFKNVRRALLRRFPYSLFLIAEDDGLVVIACFHASRDSVAPATADLTSFRAVKNEHVILGSEQCSNSNDIAPQYLGRDLCRVIAFVEDDNSPLGYAP
jgi:hypothetical protein